MSQVLYTWTTINETLCDHGEDAVEQCLEGPTGGLYTLAVLALEATRRDIISTLEEDIEALKDDTDSEALTRVTQELIDSIRKEIGSQGWTQNEPAPSRVMFTRKIEAGGVYSYSVIRMTVIE